MRRTAIILSLLLTCVCKVGSSIWMVGHIEKEERETFSWEKVIQAIIEVESHGDSSAVCGVYCGAMQISPIMVRDCNDILSMRGERFRYTYEDRFSLKKSKEMFCLIQERYNPEHDTEKAIRIWNAGPSYTLKRTEAYYRKVMDALLLL